MIRNSASKMNPFCIKANWTAYLSLLALHPQLYSFNVDFTYPKFSYR